MERSERLAEIKARLEKTTRGTWEFNGYNTIGAIPRPFKQICTIPDHPDGDEASFLPTQITERSEWYVESGHNADFIAHSPADIAWMIAEVERLSRP